MGVDHIDDLKRDWLLNQRDVLNPAELNSYRYSVAELLANGSLYTWQDLTLAVGAGSDITYSFTTGADPFVLLQILISFIGGNNSSISVEFFVGGTVSGGSLIDPLPFPRNHDSPTTSPYLNDEVFQNRTIDVAGTLFAEFFIPDSGGTNQAGAYILQQNQLYYLTLTNTGAQSADIAVEVSAGADRL